MKIELFLEKPLEQSAAIYYEKAKKAKRKRDGTKVALEKSRKELLKLLDQRDIKERKLKEEKVKKTEKAEWYEKFRWFYSSECFLCIGGRDSTSNEILIKKHAEKDDLIFHTKIEGSPFFIIKAAGKKIGQPSIEEAAEASASYSKAWKLGMSGLEVFCVSPGQLSKTAVETGANLPKGAFAVIGKMNLIQAKLQLAIGIKDGKIIGGPVNAVKKHAERSVILDQGRDSTSDIAKQIKKKLGGDIDEIIKFIPAGGTKIK